MSAADVDDIDALLDDALDDFAAQQTAAAARAAQLECDRARSAKLLDDAVQQGAAAAGGADGGGFDPAQMIQLLAQLSQMSGAAAGSGADGGGSGGGGDGSPEDDARLLTMTRQMIQGMQASAGDGAERAQLDEALAALSRAESLTAKSASAADDPVETARVHAELERLAKTLSASAAENAAALQGAAAAASGGPNAANGGMSAAERAQFDLMIAQVGRLQEQQQLSSSSAATSETPAGAIPPPDAMANYFEFVFERFASISTQYVDWFAGPGKASRETGDVTDADWARYHEQRVVIVRLLELRSLQASLFTGTDLTASAASTATATAAISTIDEAEAQRIGDELSAIVVRLQQLGDPPACFRC